MKLLLRQFAFLVCSLFASIVHANSFVMPSSETLMRCGRANWEPTRFLEHYRQCWGVPELTEEQVTKVREFFMNQRTMRVIARCEGQADVRSSGSLPDKTPAILNVYVDDLGRYAISDSSDPNALNSYFTDSCMETGFCNLKNGIVRISEDKMLAQGISKYAAYDTREQKVTIVRDDIKRILWQTYYRVGQSSITMTCRPVIDGEVSHGI